MTDRPAFDAILAARLSRRTLLGGAASTVGLAAIAQIPAVAEAGRTANTFKSLAPRHDDVFAVADGYRWNVVARWGDSLVTGTTDFDTRRMSDNAWLDAAAVDAQNRRFGTNADGAQYFSLATGRKANGLICVNHEYVSGELVFHDHEGSGMQAAVRRAWMERHPYAVAFLQAAHGVSVLHIGRDAGGWKRDITSPYNRRITAQTPMQISGPARGHPLMRTNADPKGERVLGTFANCSAGKTPWGTYLTSEENVDDYFAGGRTHREKGGDAAANEAHERLALRENSFYGWDVQDPRFDLRSEPHEPFRFGWMVEIDPHDPKSVPRKRTALGRFQHEGANTIVGKTGHVAAYMGDDDKFEYCYKFVTRDRFDPKNPAANRDLLDHGTLYAASFNADGTGQWLPMVCNEKGILNSGAGFANQGDVVIKARAAADLLGATPMDRPEDVEPSPVTGRVYIPCTKTEDRGMHGAPTQLSGREIDLKPDAANPRVNNKSGHIIEITEHNDDATALGFHWEVFLLAGNPALGRYIVDSREVAKGNLAAVDTYFGGYADKTQVSEVHCPDNLGIDPQGRLWIVTDSDGHGIPNNGCHVVPVTGPDRGRLQQLASGPTGCEMSACEFSPDGKTLFLTIQHPGEGGTLRKPTSHWPDGNGLPARASLVAVERDDGLPV